MNMKAKYAILIILVQFSYSGIAFSKIEAVLGLVALKDNLNLSNIIPISDESEIMISRDQYVISYNKERHAPNWVAWKLEANQMGQSGRSNNFEHDAELERYLATNAIGFQAVAPDDYKNSCFDRGHQIPSADRTDTEVNNKTTFLMSNMLPQTAHLNRGTWEHLEHYTRELVRSQGKKVYLIAGPIYDENFGSIGPQKNIQIPSKNFKVIFILDANEKVTTVNANTKMILVIMPNTLSDGRLPTDKAALCKESAALSVGTTFATDVNDWQQYITTVQNIEKLSGLKIQL